MAVAVGAMTHAGSASLTCDPSANPTALQLSTHPDIANNVSAGPRPPHIMGVILTQYSNQCNWLPQDCEADEAKDILDMSRFPAHVKASSYVPCPWGVSDSFLFLSVFDIEDSILFWVSLLTSPFIIFFVA